MKYSATKLSPYLFCLQDQKKLRDMLLTERESIYGSKPSPKRSNSIKKQNGVRANGNGSMTPTPRRYSVGSATPELLTPRSCTGRQNGYFKQMRRLSTAPLNFVALPKEDTISFASFCGSEPGSPLQGWIINHKMVMLFPPIIFVSSNSYTLKFQHATVNQEFPPPVLNFDTWSEILVLYHMRILQHPDAFW